MYQPTPKMPLEKVSAKISDGEINFCRVGLLELVEYQEGQVPTVTVESCKVVYDGNKTMFHECSEDRYHIVWT
ncbi:MAG: hypothetical protein V3S68_06915 [Dehalococcoidia bacterium]